MSFPDFRTSFLRLSFTLFFDSVSSFFSWKLPSAFSEEGLKLLEGQGRSRGSRPPELPFPWAPCWFLFSGGSDPAGQWRERFIPSLSLPRELHPGRLLRTSPRRMSNMRRKQGTSFPSFPGTPGDVEALLLFLLLLVFLLCQGGGHFRDGGGFHLPFFHPSSSLKRKLLAYPGKTRFHFQRKKVNPYPRELKRLNRLQIEVQSFSKNFPFPVLNC